METKKFNCWRNSSKCELKSTIVCELGHNIYSPDWPVQIVEHMPVSPGVTCSCHTPALTLLTVDDLQTCQNLLSKLPVKRTNMWNPILAYMICNLPVYVLSDWSVFYALNTFDVHIYTFDYCSWTWASTVPSLYLELLDFISPQIFISYVEISYHILDAKKYLKFVLQIYATIVIWIKQFPIRSSHSCNETQRKCYRKIN